MKIKISFLNLFLFVLFCSFGVNGKTPHFFKLKIHKEINKKTLEKVLKELNLTMDKKKFEVCRIRLNRPQIFQDFFLPIQSKAHFDNCAFQKSINYINRLDKQNYKFAVEYNLRIAKRDKQKELNLLRRKIMFNTGKALHTIQDFYAHSNYIELMQLKYKNLSEVPIIQAWTETGQKTILELEKNNNLISGRAWWVFPKKCPKNSPSHAKLAKDSVKYVSGKKPTIWKDSETGKTLNGYEAAYYFAEESTYLFLLHTFNKYPMLKGYCGTTKSSDSM